MIRPFSSKKIEAPKDSQVFRLPSTLPPETPIDLEVGCGVGWHAVTYAKNNPNRFLIAVERTTTKFQKFQNRVAHHPGIFNLLPVHADIVPWATHCLPNHLLSRIFIFYPNPYPKNSAARFFKMPFFQELLRKGRMDLTVQLVTNDFAYKSEAIEEAQKSWNLELQNQSLLNRENFPNPRTHFEKKYLLRGEPCYDLTFKRTHKE